MRVLASPDGAALYPGYGVGGFYIFEGALYTRVVAWIERSAIRGCVSNRQKKAANSCLCFWLLSYKETGEPSSL